MATVDSTEAAKKLQESLAKHMGTLKNRVNEESDHATKTKADLTEGLGWNLPSKCDGDERWFSDVFGLEPESPFKDFPVRVYEESEWDAEIQPFIPEVDAGFVFAPELIVPIVLGVLSGDNVLLYGPKGSGKSSIPEQICARMRMPFIRLGMKEDMESSELLGSHIIRGKDMPWIDGPLTIAAQFGATLCLDESSNITPGAAIALHPILEEKRRLLLSDKMGSIADRTVNIDPRFRVFLTDNTNLQGDITGKYVGTKVQNEAFIDRLFTGYNVGYMDPDREKALVLNRVPGLPEAVAGGMVRFADLVRSNYTQGTMQMTVSPRVLINWGRKAFQWGNLAEAYKAAFGARLNDDDAKVAGEHYRRVFGA